MTDPMADPPPPETPCPTCGQPHTKCAAHNRQGNPCTQNPERGMTICHYHGAKAPQTIAARDRRVALAEVTSQAERMLGRMGTDADPIEHLVECLHRSAMLTYVYGLMVADLDNKGEIEAEHEPGRQRGWSERTYEQGADGKYRPTVSMDPLMVQTSDKTVQLHPFVKEYHAALERTAKFAKLCLDAGVQERQVRLAERTGELIVSVIDAALTDAGLSGDVLEGARRAVGRRLRALPMPGMEEGVA